MYFVDREKIEQTLLFLEDTIQLFEMQTSWASPIEQKAIERVSHLIIESVLDVGNAMIDGFIMRDPGSYDDIIDILEDEKVINSSQANDLKGIIGFRKIVVQEYIHINHEQLVTAIRNHLDSIKEFSPSVRSYLENELGPVSAFRN